MKRAIFSLFLLFLLLFPFSVSAATTFYISPTGADSNQGTQSSPWKTLEKARDEVRKINKNMTDDIVINLRGGTYQLEKTFELTSEDSGTNNHSIIYQAYPGEVPVISGGIKISDWSIDKQVKDPRTGVFHTIYKAQIPSGIQSRQLYVDGQRAQRAKSIAGLPGGVKVCPTFGPGLTPNCTGYTTTDISMQSWKNQSNIELVHRTGWWKEFRCGVQSIVGGTITMKQPCFNNAQLHGDGVQINHDWTMSLPTWIENAYELLDEEGEWYMDRSINILYYIPRTGESMSQVSIILPVLETLLSGRGTGQSPLANIIFRGITFSYATWLQPNTNNGYADVQAGFTITNNQTMGTPWTKTQANVTFRYTHHIIFDQDSFTHLGGAGLGFEYGSQNNTVENTTFGDISSSGIQIGDVDQPHATGVDITSGTTITNNSIHDVGVEYHDAVGIWLGYTADNTIIHNDLFNLPYSGVSMGWGWGGDDNPITTVSRNNKIQNNFIHEYMQTLHDGGGIYTLSAQPESVIANNYIKNSGPLLHTWNPHRIGIYLDNFSRFFDVHDNVVFNVLRTSTIRGGDHTFHDNWWQDRGDVYGSKDISVEFENSGFNRYEDKMQPAVLKNNHIITSVDQIPVEMVNNAGTLLKNSSFEYTIDPSLRSPLENWSIHGPAEGSEIISLNDAFEGKNVLHIKPVTGISPGRVQQFIFQPNTRYTWSAMVKTANNSNNVTIAALVQNGTTPLYGAVASTSTADGKVFIYKPILPNNTQGKWVRLTISFQTSASLTPQQATGNIYTVVDQAPTGDVYYDNVQLINSETDPTWNQGVAGDSCPRKPLGDFNCDDKISLADFSEWRNQFKGVPPTNGIVADATGDGLAKLADFNVWRDSFKKKL